MHDMFWSLAQIISGDESFNRGLMDGSNIPPSKLRRLSIHGSRSAVGILDAITDQRCLRTLLFLSEGSAKYGDVGRFLHLRVLILKSFEIEIIPDAIYDMFYLRHLTLGEIGLEKLPESIGRLSNLQYLNLRKCGELTNLPQSITKLKNLRSLIIPPWTLDFIPKGIERLKQLNLLKGFVVGDDNTLTEHSTLTELSSLSNLRVLHLFKLERARPGSLLLGELSQLKNINLTCTYTRWSTQKTKKEISLIQELFEELIPPQCLEKLEIKFYFGRGYPKWIMSQSLGSHLPYLATLELYSNKSCPLLPPLGQLPNLRTLKISEAEAVQHIGPEFFGGGVASSVSQRRIAFPKLQLLRISVMLNLEEWFLSSEKEEDGDLQKLVLFPSLQELCLMRCPKLRALPCGLGRIKEVKRLVIMSAGRLKEVDNLPPVTECISLYENESLERISILHAPKLLTIDSCHSLTDVVCLKGLRRLELNNDRISGLPGWLSRLAKEWGRGGDEDPNVEVGFSLLLRCNRQVLQRCQQGGDDWPIIQQFHRVDAYACTIFRQEEKKYLHFVKQPFFYETNI